MGRKVMMMSLGFSAMAVVISMICLFLPFHKMTYFVLGGVKALKVVTYTIKISINIKSNDFCNLLRGAEDGFCEKVPAAKDLEDAQQRFCSEIPKRTFPNFCEGLRGAYYLGTAVVVLVVINAILCSIAGYLGYHYIQFAPKRSYRLTGVVLQLAGVVLVMMALLLYYPLVMAPLDSNRPRNGVNLLVSPADTTGIGRGYMFMWLVVIIQFIAIGLSQSGRLRGEDRLKEEREMRQYEEEIEMYNPAALQPAYDPGGYAAGPGFHPGAYSGRQHQSGFGLTALAPPTHWPRPPGYGPSQHALPTPAFGHAASGMPPLQPAPPAHRDFGIGSGARPW